MTLKDKVYGLVLAGGKSTRMGQDKGELQYHHAKQRDYVYDLLKKYCQEVFISCREDQLATLRPDQRAITDVFSGKGPLNGILSAHQKYPYAAWLVLAIDLPHLKESTITNLLQKRAPQKQATTYITYDSGKPEPLVAIWEPSAFKEAEIFFEQGKSCPRKFLSQSQIQTIYPEDDLELFNANTFEEFQIAKQRLS